MTELRRILDDEPDLALRALLDAARDDAPPDDAARRRTLLALGVGATTGAALTAGAVKLGASPGGPLAKLLSPLVLKWLVPLALSAGVGLGAVGYVHHRDARSARSLLASQQEEVAASAAASVASPAPHTGAVAAVPTLLPLPSAPAEQEEPVPSVLSTQPVVPPSPSVAAVVPPRAPKESSTSSSSVQPAPASAVAPSPSAVVAANEPADRGELAAEVKRLDLAESALTHHQPRAALALLAEYQRDFPRGALAPEATLLRIDALLLAGQRPAAELLAASFVASRPGAAYAERVRALLAR